MKRGKGRFLRLGVGCSGLAVLLGAAVSALAGGTQAGQRPNIVLILGDDLGYGDVGFNGRKEWSTPRLDQLARRGRVLRRCYSAGVVCAPSRAALMTGKYTIHSGVSRNFEDLPAEQTTIAEALRGLGYRTGLFGKWHHGRAPKGRSSYVHPMDQGFDEFCGYTNAVAAWEKFPKKIWVGREEVPVSGYFDELVTDRAVDFVKRSAGRPFFLYLSLTASHFHVAAPAEEVARYQAQFAGEGELGRVLASYAAMVSLLDQCVGRIVDALEQAGLSERTLIVFASDQGATFESGNKGASAYLDSNGPFRGQKRTLWEGGVRVPGLVCYPGVVPAGTVGEEVVSLIDLLPTFVSAAGGVVDPSWHVDGMDVLPVWRGEAPAPRRTLYWEWRTEGSNLLAALRDPYKLVILGDGSAELYNVVRDPGERRDIAAQHPGLVKELRAGIAGWLKTEAARDQ